MRPKFTKIVLASVPHCLSLRFRIQHSFRSSLVYLDRRRNNELGHKTTNYYKSEANSRISSSVRISIRKLPKTSNYNFVEMILRLVFEHFLITRNDLQIHSNLFCWPHDFGTTRFYVDCFIQLSGSPYKIARSSNNKIHEVKRTFHLFLRGLPNDYSLIVFCVVRNI